MSVQCDEEDVKATWHALNGDASTLPLAAFTTFPFDKMFECISEEGRVFFSLQISCCILFAPVFSSVHSVKKFFPRANPCRTEETPWRSFAVAAQWPCADARHGVTKVAGGHNIKEKEA